MGFGSNLRRGTARGLKLLAHGSPTVVVDDGASPIALRSTSSVRHCVNRKATVTGVTHRVLTIALCKRSKLRFDQRVRSTAGGVGVTD